MLLVDIDSQDRTSVKLDVLEYARHTSFPKFEGELCLLLKYVVIKTVTNVTWANHVAPVYKASCNVFYSFAKVSLALDVLT